LASDAKSCICAVGYFENTLKLCEVCSYPCSTCTGTAGNCTACKGTNRNNNFPNCTCAAGFFDDGINANCVACDYKCATCSGSAANCLSCSNLNRAVSNTTKCDCNTGWYDQGSSNVVCA